MRIAGYTSGTKVIYYPQRKYDAGSKKALICIVMEESVMSLVMDALGIIGAFGIVAVLLCI